MMFTAACLKNNWSGFLRSRRQCVFYFWKCD